MPTLKVAIAWLRKEDWAVWQSVDPELPSYDRWLAKIEADMEAARQNGQECEKVIVEPDAFFKWCRTNRKTIDRSTRAVYASSIVLRRLDH